MRSFGGSLRQVCKLMPLSNSKGRQPDFSNGHEGVLFRTTHNLLQKFDADCRSFLDPALWLESALVNAFRSILLLTDVTTSGFAKYSVKLLNSAILCAPASMLRRFVEDDARHLFAYHHAGCIDVTVRDRGHN